jgi:hypothetical protein
MLLGMLLAWLVLLVDVLLTGLPRRDAEVGQWHNFVSHWLYSASSVFAMLFHILRVSVKDPQERRHQQHIMVLVGLSQYS